MVKRIVSQPKRAGKRTWIIENAPNAIFYAPLNVLGKSDLDLLKELLGELEMTYTDLPIDDVNRLIPISAADEQAICTGLLIEGTAPVSFVRKILESKGKEDARYQTIGMLPVMELKR